MGEIIAHRFFCVVTMCVIFYSTFFTSLTTKIHVLLTETRSILINIDIIDFRLC